MGERRGDDRPSVRVNKYIISRRRSKKSSYILPSLIFCQLNNTFLHILTYSSGCPFFCNNKGESIKSRREPPPCAHECTMNKLTNMSLAYIQPTYIAPLMARIPYTTNSPGWLLNQRFKGDSARKLVLPVLPPPLALRRARAAAMASFFKRYQRDHTVEDCLN